MRITDIDESFNTSVSRHILKSSPNGCTIKATIGNRDIVFMSHIDNVVATVEFYQVSSDGSSDYDKTGAGAQMQVFAFVLDCIKDTIIDYNPEVIEFTAVKADGSRGRLYQKLMNKISGYSLKNKEDGRYEELFVFTRDK
jgi:hypothetical protein